MPRHVRRALWSAVAPGPATEARAQHAGGIDRTRILASVLSRVIDGTLSDHITRRLGNHLARRHAQRQPHAVCRRRRCRRRWCRRRRCRRWKRRERRRCGQQQQRRWRRRQPQRIRIGGASLRGRGACGRCAPGRAGRAGSRHVVCSQTRAERAGLSAVEVMQMVHAGWPTVSWESSGGGSHLPVYRVFVCVCGPLPLLPDSGCIAAAHAHNPSWVRVQGAMRTHSFHLCRAHTSVTLR